MTNDMVARFEGVSSPADVHLSLKVVLRRNWIPLIVVSALVGVGILYSLFGRVPITGEGNGIFLYAGTVRPFQAVADGQIAHWHVKVGDEIEKGQILCTLEQPIIQQQLDLAIEELGMLQTRNTEIRELTERYTELDLSRIQTQRKTLAGRIEVLEQHITEQRRLADENHELKSAQISRQEIDIRKLLELNLSREQEFVKRLERTEQLRGQSLSSEDDVLRDRETLSDHRSRLGDMRLQLVDISNMVTEETQSYLEALNRLSGQEDTVSDLRQQLENLANREANIAQMHMEDEFSRRLNVNDVKRRIERYRKELQESREVHSELSGRLLELTTSEGNVVSKGIRLGYIEVPPGDHELEAVAYFTLEHGKQLEPGMTVRLTPATVQIERHGSLIGRVSSITSYPVTAEGAAFYVGNSSLARDLTKDGRQIEVFIELVKDPSTYSGYSWDFSKGPETEVTSGTIASALANIEERPPISFVIPVLKHWVGL